MSIVKPVRDFTEACQVFFLAMSFLNAKPGDPKRGKSLQKLVDLKLKKVGSIPLDIKGVFERTVRWDNERTTGTGIKLHTKNDRRWALKSEKSILVSALFQTGNDPGLKDLIYPRLNDISSEESALDRPTSITRLQRAKQRADRSTEALRF